MDNCSDNFSDEFRTKIDGEDKSIFIGALDEEGKVKEVKCNLDEEYKKCRLYLDSLTRMQKLIILFYTRGHLSRILNSYNRGLIRTDMSMSVSSSRNDIYKTIINFIRYRYKLKVLDNDFYGGYFDKIIKWIMENLLITIKTVTRLLDSDTYDEENFPFKIDDKHKLQKIYNQYEKITDKYKMISKLFLVPDDTTYLLITYLLDFYFDEHISENTIYFDNIDRDINITINNAPPTERCIRLYRAADNYKDYHLGQSMTNDTITSTSCSQKTNISMFNRSNCCIVEFILKPGIRALFLNYDEAAFGEATYEVILQKNLNFTLIKIEEKNIINLNTTQEEIEIDDDNDDYQIKKMVNIEYQQPTQYSFKQIKVYLFKQI